MIVIASAGRIKALFTNGGFEAGDLSGGWTIANAQRDVMNPATPPFPRSAVQFRSGISGVDATEIVGNGTGRFAFTDPDTDPALTGGTGPGLKYPRYGNYAARVNKQNAGQRNANILTQTSTVAPEDVDPFDGKVHVAFAFAAAAVQGGSGHDAHQQPFFFVTVYNRSRGNAVLFQRYAYGGMPGVNWYDGSSISGGAIVKYTDWNIVDIAPGNGALAVGDEIELEIIAAGCDPGATNHQAWVYVDAFGSRLPGLAIAASAPQFVHAGNDLTYTYTYRNGVEDEFSGTVAKIQLPPGTTFQSVSDPVMCSYDGVDTVTCNVGAVNRSGTGTFGITVAVDPGAAPGSLVTSGNYSIEAAGEPAVYGQSVDTTVTADPLVDLVADVTGTPAVYGENVTYTVTISNPTGPNNPDNTTVVGAPVSVTLPAGVTNAQWSCVPTGGASCAGTGTGAVTDTVTIPAGGHVTYTVTGTIGAGAVVGSSLSVQAQVTVPSGYLDNDLTNNADLDVKTVAAGSVNLGVTADDGPAVITPGTTADYTFTVHNPSSSTIAGALVTLAGGSLPAELTGASWTCTAAGSGSVCPPTSGGNLNDTVTLGPNGTLTYTLHATVAPSAPVGHTAQVGITVAVPSATGYADSDPSNNTATKSSTVNALSVTSISPSGGRAEGGTLVTLKGTGFTSFGSTIPTILVGGQPATDIVVVDDTTITFRAPALPAGSPRDVVLSFSASATDQASLPTSYTPVAAPADADQDTDGDGVPDSWELLWGTDPLVDDGADDPDHDGFTNAQEYAQRTHPRGFFTRYFAEGANSWFFDTQIALGNPNVVPAATMLRYLRQDGLVGRHMVLVPADRRATFKPATLPEFVQADFSTVIESDVEIVAERTMTWLPEQRYGSHAETAITAPAPEWYLAEGATTGGFALFYLVENPNDEATTVEATYLRQAPEAPLVKSYEIGPHSRRTIFINAEEPELANREVSAVFRTTDHAGIIVERAMYLSTPATAGQEFGLGTDAAGVTAPSTHWFFAEGATGSFFDLFMLLANPGDTPAHVTLRYLRPFGAPIEVPHTIDPHSRVTINAKYDDEALATETMSIVVESDQPVLAERAMYWPGLETGGWAEGHVSTGATETGTAWAVADGELGGAFDAETYVLIANTSDYEGRVRISLLLEDGAPVSTEITLGANSRYSAAMGLMDEFKDAVKDKRFSVLVESLGATPAQIVVERSTYSSDAAGTRWAAGSAALGTKLR